MKFKVFVWTCLAILAVVPAAAQQRSITNADLEKYRQKRLQAEKDYNENYAKLGFPSPEELQKQIEKSRVEREALAARLAAERLERERAEAEREAMRQVFVPDTTVINDGYYGPAYANPYYFRRPFRSFRPNFRRPQFNVGNGIPIVNYYGIPRRQRPVNMSTRR